MLFYTTTGDFSDDKIFLVIYANPETALSLIQNHLDLPSIWYKEWGIKVNEIKFIQYISTLKKTDCPHVYLKNVPLSTVLNVGYPGLHLDRRLIGTIHVHFKHLTLNNRSRILRYFLKSKHLNLKNKLTYKMLLEPIWTYGEQLRGAAKPSIIISTKYKCSNSNVSGK